MSNHWTYPNHLVYQRWWEKSQAGHRLFLASLALGLHTIWRPFFKNLPEPHHTWWESDGLHHSKNDDWENRDFFTAFQISPLTTSPFPQSLSPKCIDLFLSFLLRIGREGIGKLTNQQKGGNPPISRKTIVSESIDTRWIEQCSQPLVVDYHRRWYYPPCWGLNIIQDENAG